MPVKKAKGRRQKTEGSNMVWALTHHQLQATKSKMQGGGLRLLLPFGCQKVSALCSALLPFLLKKQSIFQGEFP
jgi:hypothetical protein